MFNRITHRFYKRSFCCAVFLFSFFLSFSAYIDHQVRGAIEFESKVDLDQIHYSESSYSCQGHLSESPENPFETGSDVENENEKENESDDDENESGQHFFTEDVSYFKLNSTERTFTYFNSSFVREIVPLYILFHSWKSYLG